MRDMEGKVCDIKWKSKVCHINHNFEIKYTVLSNFIKIWAWNETRPPTASKDIVSCKKKQC